MNTRTIKIILEVLKYTITAILGYIGGGALLS